MKRKACVCVCVCRVPCCVFPCTGPDVRAAWLGGYGRHSLTHSLPPRNLCAESEITRAGLGELSSSTHTLNPPLHPSLQPLKTLPFPFPPPVQPYSPSL